MDNPGPSQVEAEEAARILLEFSTTEVTYKHSTWRSLYLPHLERARHKMRYKHVHSRCAVKKELPRHAKAVPYARDIVKARKGQSAVRMARARVDSSSESVKAAFNGVKEAYRELFTDGTRPDLNDMEFFLLSSHFWETAPAEGADPPRVIPDWCAKKAEGFLVWAQNLVNENEQAFQSAQQAAMQARDAHIDARKHAITTKNRLIRERRLPKNYVEEETGYEDFVPTVLREAVEERKRTEEKDREGREACSNAEVQRDAANFIMAGVKRDIEIFKAKCQALWDVMKAEDQE